MIEIWVNGCLWEVVAAGEVLASIDNARLWLGSGIRVQIRGDR